MARRKDSTRGTDRFYVGQRVIFTLDKSTGWEAVNGEQGRIVGPKQLHAGYCSRFEDRYKSAGVPSEDARYEVEWRDGLGHFCENHLRPLDDGNEVSTWEKFAKATGINRMGCAITPKSKKRAVRYG